MQEFLIYADGEYIGQMISLELNHQLTGVTKYKAEFNSDNFETNLLNFDLKEIMIHDCGDETTIENPIVSFVEASLNYQSKVDGSFDKTVSYYRVKLEFYGVN